MSNVTLGGNASRCHTYLDSPAATAVSIKDIKYTASNTHLHTHRHSDASIKAISIVMACVAAVGPLSHLLLQFE